MTSSPNRTSPPESKYTQVKTTLIRGVTGLTKAALGIDRATDDHVRQRREICAGCHHAIGRVQQAPSPAATIGRVTTCRVCNCLLQPKTLLAGESCPLEKWVAVAVNATDDADRRTIRHAFQLMQDGNLHAAATICNEILLIAPKDRQAQHLLGIIAQRQGQLELASQILQQAIQNHPQAAELHNTLGTVLGQAGRHDQALECFHRAIALDPNYPEAHNNAGTSLMAIHKIPAAIAAHQRAIELRPTYAEAHHYLGVAYRKQGDLEAAQASHERAVALRSTYAEALHCLGEIHLEEGNAVEAVQCLRKAVELRANDPTYHSDLLFTLGNLPEITPEQLFLEHREWSRHHESPHAGARTRHENDRTPNRRLRIGYVSADFREHTTARFVEPLLTHHDRQQFEVYCYSDVTRPDALTAHFRTLADQWRDTARLSHTALAALIRKDQIDILLDVTGHMGGNRLPLFAYKPAPVQITYRGYPCTSGLEAMDYVITDALRDPPDIAERHYTERIIRLEGASQCYVPTDTDLEVSPQPVRASGVFTFGSLNHPRKYSPFLIEIWARILRAVPSSRLMLLRGADPESPRQTRQLFALEGIARERLVFAGPQPRRNYLQLYQQIDLGLDPFPFNGHTTSLDSLCMGVPFVSLEGGSCLSRIGFSLLTTLGLDDMITKTCEDYVNRAVQNALQWEPLSVRRAQIRELFLQSPLCAAASFTKALERACEIAWKTWCGSQEDATPKRIAHS